MSALNFDFPGYGQLAYNVYYVYSAYLHSRSSCRINALFSLLPRQLGLQPSVFTTQTLNYYLYPSSPDLLDLRLNHLQGTPTATHDCIFDGEINAVAKHTQSFRLSSLFTSSLPHHVRLRGLQSGHQCVVLDAPRKPANAMSSQQIPGSPNIGLSAKYWAHMWSTRVECMNSYGSCQ